MHCNLRLPDVAPVLIFSAHVKCTYEYHNSSFNAWLSQILMQLYVMLYLVGPISRIEVGVFDFDL